MSTTTKTRSVPAEALPLVIGVTGHRDLVREDEDTLRQVVGGILDEIRKNFLTTPLVLLSSLADGADRLVAEVAQEKGIDVVAPLPLRRDLYAADFAGDARTEWEKWLNERVKCWFELPLPDGITEAQVAVPGQDRSQQYGRAGKYIARHCQILIALWDGLPGEEGGTEKIYKYKKDGPPRGAGTPPSTRLEPVEAALLYHVVTPRQGQHRPPEALQVRTFCTAEPDEEATNEGGTVDALAPALKPYRQHTEASGAVVDHQPIAAHMLNNFRRIFAPTERYNRDAQRHASRLKAARDRSRIDLLGSPSPAVAGLAPLEPLLQRFTLADSLALYYKGWTTLILWGLYVLIFFGVLCFDVTAHEVLESKLILLGFIVLLAAAYGWYGWSRKMDYQNKYQDYRALAEGLRVQLFRRLAGLGELQAAVADHYLLKHATNLDWIRNALRTWSSSWSFPAARGQLALAEPPPANLTFVREHWVQHQAGFFHPRVNRFHQLEHRLHLWSKHIVLSISVLLILVAVGAWYLSLAQQGKEAPIEPTHWVHFPLLVVSILLVITALMHDYITKLALAEHAKTYRRMKSLFRKANALLEECEQHRDEDGGKDIIQRLGQEALVENGDWLLLHRDRPVTVPQL